jgi:Domain of unknown function (DUF4349)
MSRKVASLLLTILTLIATGCAKRAVLPPAVSRSNFLTAKLQPAAFVTGSQRFIAERDKIEIVTPEPQLERSWQSVVAFCGTIRCEVVSSSITMRTSDSAPSGNISLRVAPEDLHKLVANIESLGKVAQHSSERNDETNAVIDSDARIKNLTAFRDNLRAMLARPSATISNIVEIDKQLTDTQAELDSETAERKILANETEKIAVEISFRVPETAVSTSGVSEIWDALHGAGSVLGDSLANLITTIIFLIPWLALLLPLVWLLAKGWRRLRKSRVGTAAPTAR